MKLWVFASLLCLTAQGAWAIALGRYKVTLGSWTTSGISSGACMATMMHVIYSAEIKGTGTVAAAPYWCAEGSALRATNVCMGNPAIVSVSTLTSKASSLASQGRIDNTANLVGSKVFIFQGSLDTAVEPPAGPKMSDFYSHFGANIETNFNMAAVHGYPNTRYGTACNVVNSVDYMNNCNYYAAYEILNHLYGGGLTKPSQFTGSTAGSFYMYDQREFFDVTLPGQWSMDSNGYVYVPTACLAGATCRLHVAFHGCSQGAYHIGTDFIDQSGYKQVGEANNIIILFPQAVNSVALGNPYGCWDWWGYTNGVLASDTYVRNNAAQPLAVHRMMAKASSG